MERLRLRGFVLGVCLIAAGAAIQAMPRPQLHAKDETFMIAKAPTQIGAFKFVQGQTKPGCSYDVDERTFSNMELGLQGEPAITGNPGVRQPSQSHLQRPDHGMPAVLVVADEVRHGPLPEVGRR